MGIWANSATQPDVNAMAAKIAARDAMKRDLGGMAEEIGQRRALEILSGKITCEMIEAAAAQDRYRYKGVPVTEVQFNALMKAEGFDTGRR